MNDFIKKYHIEAEALTPIFIGGGTSVDISKKDYYIDDKENKIYVLDMTKFMDFIIKNPIYMKAYENFIKDINMTFNEFLNTNIGKSINLSNIKNKYCNNIIDINDADIRGGSKQLSPNRKNDKANNFSGFIKNSEGYAFVPGSSIKGALRTIMIKYYLVKKINNNYINEIDNTINKPRCNDYKKIEVDIFNDLERDDKHKSNAVNDKMCDLSISDSNIIKDELMLCEKIDINPKGDKKNLGALFRECLKPNTKIGFDIVLKDNKFDINDILKAIKENVINYHNNYINKYDKACVYNDLFIPIGGGVGFISKTFTMEASGGTENGLKNISRLLNKLFFNHHHEFDFKKGFAPRLRKMASYNDKLYDMGLLAIKKVVETKTNKEIPIPKVFN